VKVAEKIKTCILRSTTFPENCSIYEMIWKKNMAEPDRPQMTICALHAA